MGPKKQTKIKVEESSHLASGEKQESKDQEKKSPEKFSCHCGKIYGSLAAVHTHINNKHSDTPDMKKFFKLRIINPKKQGQPQTNSIRMKDISFDDSQAELMCHADITLKNIYDIIKPPGEKNIKDDILINVSEGFSDSDDLDIDQLLGMSESEKDQRESSNKRQRTIYQKVDKLKEKYGINDINQYVQGAQQFKSFQKKKFRLNLIRELSKFFVVNVAAKIEFSIQLIHVIKKHAGQNGQLAMQANAALNDIWLEFPKIRDILEEYYVDWIEIKRDWKVWKQRQEQRQRLSEPKEQEMINDE